MHGSRRPLGERGIVLRQRVYVGMTRHGYPRLGGGGGNRTRVHAYEKRAMARVQGLRRFGRRPASVAASGGHEADGALEKVFRCLLVPEFQTILLEARHSHWKASPTATDVRAAIWQAKTSVAPGRSSSSSAPVG